MCLSRYIASFIVLDFNVIDKMYDNRNRGLGKGLSMVTKGTLVNSNDQEYDVTNS